MDEKKIRKATTKKIPSPFSSLKIGSWEPLIVALYFLVITLLLGGMGATNMRLAKVASELMQEHIAGTSIKIFGPAVIFAAVVCAMFRLRGGRDYSCWVGILVINPTNFVVTLSLVAAAIAWGVTLSAIVWFPAVAQGEVRDVLIGNSLQILGISMWMWLSCWALHQPRTNKFNGGPAATAFWTALVLNLVWMVSMLLWLIYLALAH